MNLSCGGWSVAASTEWKPKWKGVRCPTSYLERIRSRTEPIGNFHLTVVQQEIPYTIIISACAVREPNATVLRVL